MSSAGARVLSNELEQQRATPSSLSVEDVCCDEFETLTAHLAAVDLNQYGHAKVQSAHKQMNIIEF